MNLLFRKIVVSLAVLEIFSTASAFSAGNATVPTAVALQQPFKMPGNIRTLLDSNCCSCHDSTTRKGKVQLDNIEQLAQPERLELLNRVLEQVYSGEMPPKDEDQPTAAERTAMVSWLWGDLKAHNACKLEDKLRYYRYGNYVDHGKLFSGEIQDAPFTPARRWRINELIYLQLVNDVFELQGRDRKDSFYGVVKPFNLPAESGVKYYANEVVEGGQAITMLANAKWIVDKQLRPALEKSGEFKFSAQYLEDKQAVKDRKMGSNSFRNKYPDEEWNLRKTAEPFEKVIMDKGTPSDELLKGAITHQFKVAMQREPTPAETNEYLAFMKSTMKTSDKTSALKKMMVSVLMDVGFLYRSEFGGGPRDGYGRVMLTPREGSYAIAYALTDKVPDKTLASSAASGKLSTRQDYEREVRRMLADSSIAKPRILRFFQDYFGYYGVYDVFKDEERFVGPYNPHRIVSTNYIYRVPGKVAKEADALVEWVLKKDKAVLETLLTTDQFFVHHNGNNEEMRQKAEAAQKRYDNLRELYKAAKLVKKKDYPDVVRKLGQEKFYGLDKPNKDGGQNNSLPPRFYGDLKLAEIYFGKDGAAREKEGGFILPEFGEKTESAVKMYNLDYATWNYVVEQPFKVEHRAGMLTHPAWLVAFSHNTATDPIRRGKWVREKLLGGFVRDVPITVDAKVPDDPHKTLRERFSVSEAAKCWQCHVKMNPLGYTFESYDDFGCFRTNEEIEYPENVIEKKEVLSYTKDGVVQNVPFTRYKTKPVNAAGLLDGTGDKSLDGPVKDVPDMMRRLAKSERVRQVFIRNVFRYFMGRNETLSDSQTLFAADKAYVKSGGSFNELIVSLLTSDSFIYRK